MKLSAAPTPGATGPLRPLASGSVTLRGGLLGERATTNATVSLPHGYAMLGQHGALDYLRRAARASGGRWPPPPVRDGHGGTCGWCRAISGRACPLGPPSTPNPYPVALSDE